MDYSAPGICFRDSGRRYILATTFFLSYLVHGRTRGRIPRSERQVFQSWGAYDLGIRVAAVAAKNKHVQFDTASGTRSQRCLLLVDIPAVQHVIASSSPLTRKKQRCMYIAARRMPIPKQSESAKVPQDMGHCFSTPPQQSNSKRYFAIDTIEGCPQLVAPEIHPNCNIPNGWCNTALETFTPVKEMIHTILI